MDPGSEGAINDKELPSIFAFIAIKLDRLEYDRWDRVEPRI